MKKLILSLAMMLTINFANSQSTIYGFKWDVATSTQNLISINPTTGAITQIDSISGLQFMSSDVFTINTTSNSLNVTDRSGLIYDIDISTGNIVSQKTLTKDIMELHFDKVSGNYYAIELSTPLNFVTVNPATGVVTTIDSIPGVSFVGARTSAYDSKNHQFVFVGDKNIIYTLDATNGSIVSSQVLTATINELHLNSATGVYYAIENDATRSTNYLVNVNNVNGNVTRIDSIQGLRNFELGTSTLDTLNNLYSIVDRNNTLFSVDLSNASVVYSPTLSSTVSNLSISAVAGGGKIDLPIETMKMEAYPNPAKNKLFINTDEIPTSLKVYNKLGVLVEERILNSSTNTIDVSNLEKDMYFFNLSTPNKSKTKKILIL